MVQFSSEEVPPVKGQGGCHKFVHWRCKVDTLIQRLHAHEKIKHAVLDVLEDRPKRIAQAVDTANFIA